MLTLRDSAKVFALAAGTFLGSAVAAQADCKVVDTDKTAFLGGHKTYSRTFEGSSVVQIWEKYCKPFIQKTIANEDINNGRFSMHCTGRLSCRIEGRIVNGKPVYLKMDGLGVVVPPQPAPAEPVRKPKVTKAEPAPAPEVHRPKPRPVCDERIVRSATGEKIAVRDQWPNCTKVEVEVVPADKPERKPAKPRAEVSVTIENDPGWAYFDQAVRNCEARKSGKTVAATAPTCK